MSIFTLILVFGLAMSAIALVGSLTLILPEKLFQQIVLPLVSLAAGTLIGGALLHLLPHAIQQAGNTNSVFIALTLGFLVLFFMEQFLHWHHCHQSQLRHEVVSYLILLADGLHNFIGGLVIGSAFMIDTKLGILTWLIAALHEIPQELGDFGILLNSGWKPKHALIFNFISALTFPIGALIAYAISGNINVSLLLAFGAGNFLYIGATDLIPQLKTKKSKLQAINALIFIFGISIMLTLKLFLHD